MVAGGRNDLPLPLREGIEGRGLRAAARREAGLTSESLNRFFGTCRRQTPPPNPSRKGRGRFPEGEAVQYCAQFNDSKAPALCATCTRRRNSLR
jgi:hypothetical protein